METIRIRWGSEPDFDSKIVSAQEVYERDDFSQKPGMLVAVMNDRGKVYRIIAANNVRELSLVCGILMEIGLENVLDPAPKGFWARVKHAIKYSGYAFVFSMPKEDRITTPIDPIDDAQTTEERAS